MSTESQDRLPTGLASLDTQLEGGGLRAGSLAVVRAPAQSIGRRFAFNLCAERPIHYATVGHDPTRYVDHIRTVAGVSPEQIDTASFPLADSVETLTAHLDDAGGEMAPATTTVVDPLTPVERLGEEETAAALTAIRTVLDSTEGLGIALALTDEGRQTPTGRWVTLSQADAVFSITHETDEDGVTHHLAIDRLPMGQRLKGEARTFQLPQHVDMTLDTSKTLSP